MEELAAILTSEVGKPLQQSRNEINGGKSENKMAHGKCRKIFVR